MPNGMANALTPIIQGTRPVTSPSPTIPVANPYPPFNETQLKALEERRGVLTEKARAQIEKGQAMMAEAQKLQPPHHRGLFHKEDPWIMGVGALLAALFHAKGPEVGAALNGFIQSRQQQANQGSEDDLNDYNARRTGMLQQAEGLTKLGQFDAGQADDVAQDYRGELGRKNSYDQNIIDNMALDRRHALTLDAQNGRADAKSKADQAKQQGNTILQMFKVAGVNLADPEDKKRAMSGIMQMIQSNMILPEVVNDPDFVAAMSGQTIAGARTEGQLGRYKSQNETDKVKRAQGLANIKLTNARRGKVEAETRDMPTELAIKVAKANAYLDDIADRVASRGWNDTLKAAKADKAATKAILDSLNAGIKTHETTAAKLLGLRDEIADMIQGETDQATRESLAKKWNALDDRYQEQLSAKKQLESESKDIRQKLSEALQEKTQGRAPSAAREHVQAPKGTIGGAAPWDPNAKVKPYDPTVNNGGNNGQPLTVIPRVPVQATAADELAATRRNITTYQKQAEAAAKSGNSKAYSENMRALAYFQEKAKRLQSKAGTRVTVSRG
jgi:hypothetical protein